MSKLKVQCFSMSVDGFGAGPNQGLEQPMGEGGMRLHEWVFPTRSFQRMHGGGDGGDGGGGSTGVDNDFAERGMAGLGAWILGRHMFGPVRGPWPEGDTWKGWWGPNPPYHCPVSTRIATSQSSKISSLAIFTRTPSTPGSCIRRWASLPIRLSSRLTCSAVHSSMMIWRTLR